MRIILKPGALFFLVAVAAALLYVVIRPLRNPQPDTPLHSARIVSTPRPTPTLSKLPYELDTPTGALRGPDFEGEYLPVRQYKPDATLQGTVAAHWFDDSSWAPVTIDYAPSKTMPHGGASCQEIHIRKNTAEGAVQFVQALQLKSGQKYTGGLWLRADRPTTVELQLRQVAQPLAMYGISKATIGPQWQQVTAAGQIGPDGMTYLLLKVFTSDTTVWVDDATLTPAR